MSHTCNVHTTIKVSAWYWFPPYIRPCCWLHFVSLPSLGIYSVSCKTVNKRNFFLWPMHVSLHSGYPFLTLRVSPSPEAGYSIVLGKKRVSSGLILFFNTVNLALFSQRESWLFSSNGTVLLTLILLEYYDNFYLYMRPISLMGLDLPESLTLCHSHVLWNKYIILSFCPILSALLFSHTAPAPIITRKRINVSPV